MMVKHKLLDIVANISQNILVFCLHNHGGH
jgi:hypothetical protein